MRNFVIDILDGSKFGLFMKKDNGKFDFKGDWAEGKTAEEYADDLRSTCSFTRKVETW